MGVGWEYAPDHFGWRCRGILGSRSVPLAQHERRRREDEEDAEKGRCPYTQLPAAPPAHKLLIPEEIVSQSSEILSRNAMIAMMAMTTSTPTRIGSLGPLLTDERPETGQQMK